MKKNEYRVMKRIFIGVKIDPGTALMNMIADFRTSLENERIKWTEIDNFHITLAFLGDTEQAKIIAISKMLKSVCEKFGEFELQIKGAGVFKSFKDARILWTGIEPSEQFNILFDSIKAGLEDIGIPLEDRPFSPHLTLGRLRSINNIDRLKSLIGQYLKVEMQTQLINEVILYQSVLLPAGPVYKPIGKFNLFTAV